MSFNKVFCNFLLFRSSCVAVTILGNMERDLIPLCLEYLKSKSIEFDNTSSTTNITSYNDTIINGAIDTVTTEGAQNSLSYDLDLANLCNPVDGGLNLSHLPKTEKTILNAILYYLTGICRLIVCILGFIGNMMSVVVLTGKIYNASSTYVYLIALAVSDSLLLVTALVLSLNDIFTETMEYNRNISEFIAFTFPYISPLCNTFQTISIWLTLGFTVDRYIMICHPFQGVKFCSRKRAVLVVLGLHILGVMFTLPQFFEKKTVVKYIEGHKIIAVDYTTFGKSQGYLSGVHLWAYLIFIFVLPCVTLAVLNFLLILAVKKSRSTERRMSLGVTTAHRNDTTVMLVAVVLVFMVCQLPALVSHTIWATDPETFLQGGEKYMHLHIMLEVSNFLVVLNSAVNILLYYGFSQKFRKEFAATFCRPCLRQSKVIVTELTRRFSKCSTENPDNIGTQKSGCSGNGVHSKKRRIKKYLNNNTPNYKQANGHNPIFHRQSTSITFAAALSIEAVNLVGTNNYTKLVLSSPGRDDSGSERTNSNNNVSCTTVSVTSSQIGNEEAPISHV